MKPANATVQDDIPPVHVLEAAQNQDRKETEDLLAGFDRPGRSPKPAPKERDFVDYYARKKSGRGESGASGAGAAGAGSASNAGGAANAPARQRDVSTVIVHRERKGMPLWLGWAAVTVGMLVVGGAVAYLATADGHPSASEPSAPSAATTITSSTTPVQVSPDTSVPPPDPAPPTTVVEPTPSAPTTATAMPTGAPTAQSARSASKRDGRTAPSAATDAPATTPAAAATAPAPRGTNATDDRKPPPRDDFIRDL